MLSDVRNLCNQVAAEINLGQFSLPLDVRSVFVIQVDRDDLQTHGVELSPHSRETEVLSRGEIVRQPAIRLALFAPIDEDRKLDQIDQYIALADELEVWFARNRGPFAGHAFSGFLQESGSSMQYNQDYILDQGIFLAELYPQYKRSL
jgi:hypothetical protein